MRRAELALAFSVLLPASVAPGIGQTQNTAATGARRYAQFCAGCHGADGRGGDKAVSLVTNQNFLNRSDDELFRIVHDGSRNGMPPFAQIGDANITAILHFLRSLEEDGSADGALPRPSVTGNADAGRTLFFGRGECAHCHMVHGEGGFMAANLTTYARNRSPGTILQTIVAPDSPQLEPASRVVSVTTNTGEKVSGVLRNEDAFNLAIQSEDGRYHLFSRGELSAIRYSDHSLMPADYATRLTSSELDDIVSFLIASSKGSQPAAGRDQ